MRSIGSMAEEDKQTKVPVLAWMRNPVDVSLSEECQLQLVPFLDSRYCSELQLMISHSDYEVNLSFEIFEVTK